MTFRRSSRGLSNLHMFAKVDLVVFTEGGSRTIPKDRASGGETQNPGMDVVFWRELFNKALPGIKVSFRALGSKNVLKDIATDVVRQKTERVCVAMDRDYDAHWGRLVRSRNVIYTRGYSWENELLTARVIEVVFYELAQVDRARVRVRGLIQRTISSPLTKWGLAERRAAGGGP